MGRTGESANAIYKESPRKREARERTAKKGEEKRASLFRAFNHFARARGSRAAVRDLARNGLTKKKKKGGRERGGDADGRENGRTVCFPALAVETSLLSAPGVRERLSTRPPAERRSSRARATVAESLEGRDVLHN